MGVAWPSTLPKTFQQSSFNETPQDGVIRTTMDTGPVKTRRRFTATSKYWTGIMVMTYAEKLIWDSYYENSIAYGSLVMSFPNQFDAGVTTVEARLRSPVSFVPDGGTMDWKGSFDLEVLP